MAQYISKAALVAEIDRRKHKLLDNIIFESDKEWVARTVHQLNRIILFIDSLEVKEVQGEAVNENLEGAAQEYVTKEGYLAGLHYNSMVRAFKAGAEWYASHNTKQPDNLLLAARKASIAMCDYDEKYLDEYPYDSIAEQKFIEGANWQKEQLKAKDEEKDETKGVDLDKSARHYLLHEHISPLNEVLHQADLKAEMQYHKDIENAYKAGFELGLKQKGE